MLGVLLTAMQLASAQPASTDRDIVIVGRRAQTALARCLERNCPPEEEVEAALAASVEQFVAARYVDARVTLQRAIRRNRMHAATLPGPVSSMYATLATVAQHEGDMELMGRSARANVAILDTHIGPAHPSTLVERLTQGDLMVLQGSRMGADAAYRMVSERAMTGGHRMLAAGATFRRAWLSLLARRFTEAERLGDQALALGGGDPMIGNLHAILVARIATLRGDEGAVDALVQRLRQSNEARPTMVFQPPLDGINPDRRPGGPGTIEVFVDAVHDTMIRYADVGYWIRPDGRTAEVELLRTNGLGQWRAGILRQVEGRRYVPTDLEAGDPGTYRIDRFTVRGEMDVPTGSRIRRRMGNLSAHVIDLTETEEMAETRRRQVEQASRGQRL